MAWCSAQPWVMNLKNDLNMAAVCADCYERQRDYKEAFKGFSQESSSAARLITSCFWWVYRNCAPVVLASSYIFLSCDTEQKIFSCTVCLVHAWRAGGDVLAFQLKTYNRSQEEEQVRLKRLRSFSQYEVQPVFMCVESLDLGDRFKTQSCGHQRSQSLTT